MNVYDLPLISSDSKDREDIIRKTYSSLPPSLLVEYTVWFCHFRWVVVVILTAFGLLHFLPAVFHSLGLKTQTSWAFIIAGVLVITNIAYLYTIFRMKKSETYDRIMVNIWIQIILDLIILTAVIHYSGSLDTLIPFAYLFHIVLACIFFPSRQSLIVTVFVSFLYLTCIGAEILGIIPVAGIYADSTIRNLIEQNSTVAAVNVITSLGIWMVVWYLVSYLSTMVREREYELAETNKRLELAQKEKIRHMLRTTHELKAPFAAIDANIQLLFKGHCGVLPDKAIEVLERIFSRSRRLGSEIQEMLQLANLQNVGNETIPRERINLKEIIEWCKIQIQVLSDKKENIFREDVQPAFVYANIDQMKMLFHNLLSNAITYSHHGGIVNISCTISPDQRPVVVIEDHGIGISKEKVSRIFDEYYRTDEAAA